MDAVDTVSEPVPFMVNISFLMVSIFSSTHCESSSCISFGVLR